MNAPAAYRASAEGAPAYMVRQPAHGPVQVPKGRYLDDAYAALEASQLWSRVWQLACFSTDVPNPGDYVEYQLGDQSYVILRDEAGELRAFHNVCPHRGFKLCEGSGCASEGTIQCGYHNWRFGLDGAVREITSQRAFGGIERASFDLRPVRLAQWAQMVFINPSNDGPSFDEFIDVLPAELARFAFDDRICTFRCTVIMEGNWKVTVDAFNEVYHLQGLHPQLMEMMDDVHTTYRVFANGHSMMQIPVGVGSPRLGALSDERVVEALHDCYGSMFGARGEGPVQLRGRTSREYAVARVRERCETGDYDVSHLSNADMVDDFHYLAFPNLVFNVHSEMHTIFRARPGATPHTSFFDFYVFKRLPDLPGGPKLPADHVAFPVGSRINEVLDQDLDGVSRVHAGLRSSGLDHVTFGDWECRLTAMHCELDRYLAPSPPNFE